jgi:hypothetical protein
MYTFDNSIGCDHEIVGAASQDSRIVSEPQRTRIGRDRLEVASDEIVLNRHISTRQGSCAAVAE